jgi:hypothetical protein
MAWQVQLYQEPGEPKIFDLFSDALAEARAIKRLKVCVFSCPQGRNRWTNTGFP